MTAPTDTARQLARIAAGTFGGDPEVRRYYDDAHTHHVDVLSCSDRPTPGLVTYSTVTLHDSPNVMAGADVRIEVAGVAPAACGAFANMLATAAFFVMKDNWLCAPGVVFPGIVRDYKISGKLQHLMWAPPFPWEELGGVQIPGEVMVHWLLAIPISEGERKLLTEVGFDRFEHMLESRGVEYFDTDRVPIA